MLETYCMRCFSFFFPRNSEHFIITFARAVHFLGTPGKWAYREKKLRQSGWFFIDCSNLQFDISPFLPLDYQNYENFKNWYPDPPGKNLGSQNYTHYTKSNISSYDENLLAHAFVWYILPLLYLHIANSRSSRHWHNFQYYIYHYFYYCNIFINPR
jgi:hypothetical protein